MPSQAKVYIAMIGATAGAVLALAVSRWNAGSLKQFAVFFALAMLASALKVRLPGFKTTISLNFVFVLMGIAMFSLGETVLVGLGGALVQSLWNAQQRPKAVQVFFNAACLTVSSAAAFWAAHNIPSLLGLHSLIATLVLGTCVYMALNTGLVSVVISLAEGRQVRELWSSCYEWTFPYFVVGAAVAGLASAAANGVNLGASLLAVPAMYMAYLHYRMHILRAVLQNISDVSQEDEALLASASRGN